MEFLQNTFGTRRLPVAKAAFWRLMHIQKKFGTCPSEGPKQHWFLTSTLDEATLIHGSKEEALL